MPGPATGAIGAGGAGRPGAATLPSGAGRPGGAAADFLQQGGAALGGAAIGAGIASQLPAGGANRPNIGDGQIGAGNRPANPIAGAGRPGADLGRPGTPDVGRPGTPDAGRPGRPGDNWAQNQPGRIENRGERQDNRNQRRDEIRDQYHDNNPGSFWEQYPGWSAWAITRPFAWATWGSVGSWCGYSDEQYPYSYGENVYYADDQVYYGDQVVATADEYAQQAADLAASVPMAATENAEWLPLGVFALTQDGQASGAQPTLYMQLAISKQGVISGTFTNTVSGKVQSLEGMADKKNQRVAWVVTGQQHPIMETGLTNLTQDTAPALIHFADGQTQQWLMVRLPEPKQ
jgi:hypothetical protein